MTVYTIRLIIVSDKYNFYLLFLLMLDDKWELYVNIWICCLVLTPSALVKSSIAPCVHLPQVPFDGIPQLGGLEAVWAWPPGVDRAPVQANQV